MVVIEGLSELALAPEVVPEEPDGNEPGMLLEPAPIETSGTGAPSRWPEPENGAAGGAT